MDDRNAVKVVERFGDDDDGIFSGVLLVYSPLYDRWATVAVIGDTVAPYPLSGGEYVPLLPGTIQRIARWEDKASAEKLLLLTVREAHRGKVPRKKRPGFLRRVVESLTVWALVVGFIIVVSLTAHLASQ